MCSLCDGMSEEDFNRNIAEKIDEYGWFITGVEPSPGELWWLYTVGLLEGFGHPELVLIGLPQHQVMRILNGLGNEIRAGARIDPNNPGNRSDGLTFGPVAPEQWRLGTFAGWTDYYRWRGEGPDDPSAVQVFLNGWPETRSVLLTQPELGLHDVPAPRPARRHHRRPRSRA